MAVNSIYRVSLEYTAFGQNLANVFHFRQVEATDNAPATDADVLATRFFTEVVPKYQPILSDQTLMNLVVVKGVTDPNEGSELPIAVPGNGPDDPMPLNVAALLSWRTNLATRSGRGRTYIGGFDEGFADNGGALTATALAQMADVATALRVTMLASDPVSGAWEFGIWSRTLEAFNPVTQSVVRSFTKSQRDRSRK